MASPIIMIFLNFLLLGHVAADDGDDFSNNLFTDLSPLLALFGERVTMQFLSQAMGFSDCIILAVAPLGIITIIVAAIRVGGPSWLKALIGRATEGRAAAELELMSSTSNEIGELWNGTDVVRCAGSAPVWEFICLLPSEGVPENPEVIIMSMEDAVEKSYITKSSKNTSDQTMTHSAPETKINNKKMTLLAIETKNSDQSKIRTFITWLLSNKQEEDAETGNIQTSSVQTSSEQTNSVQTSDANTSDAQKKQVIIIKNTKQDAPNISHNRCKNTGRSELHVAAFFGILLQIGVILYCGIITQFSRIAAKFQKDGNPVGSYAFPLTTIGTVVLLTGMLICCRVVESSTEEIIFRPTENWRARMVWLQREKTVGDQEFKSFALFTGEDQPTIITSSRKDKGEIPDKVDQNGNGNGNSNGNSDDNINGSDNSKIPEKQTNKKEGVEFMSVVGTTTSLIGFFTQFIGIRGMHWSASIASLIATLMMTAVRAWVRRGLTRPMLSERLRSGHELDWFADTLKDVGGAPWYVNPSTAVEKKSVGPKNGETASVNQKELIMPHPQTSTTQNFNDFETENCIKHRHSLAKLAGWRGPVLQEAIAIASAIEATMNLLVKDSKPNPFDWHCNIKNSSTLEKGPKFKVTTQEDGKWNADAGVIEAALSLRLFYAKHQDGAEPSTRTTGNFPRDDKRLRVKGDIPDMGIRILGPHTMRLFRHLGWWIPADGPQISDGKYVSDNNNIDVEESRVVGIYPHRYQILRSGYKTVTDIVSHYYGESADWRWKFKLPKEKKNSLEEEDKTSTYIRGADNSLLFIRSLDSLELLYAKDMFSTFMWTVVESLAPIKGNMEIQPAQAILDDEDSWISLALRHDGISRLAIAIQSTGLCSTHDAYISIISPLSLQQKLPALDGIVEMVRNHTKEFEARQAWEDAGKVYLQLGNHLETFAVGSYTYARAIAVLVAFKRAIGDMVGRYKKDDRSMKSHSNLEKQLERTMRNVDRQLQRNLESLYELEQTDIWRGLSINSDLLSLYQDLLFNSLKIYRSIQDGLWAQEEQAAKTKDIFDRTPLHYCAAFDYDSILEHQIRSSIFISDMQYLIEHSTGINECDIRGWTPLHYACRAGNTLMARFLLEKGASVDVQGREGTAPIHCAAGGGHFEIVKALLEYGATVGIPDGFGDTPLNKAAVQRSVETVETLHKHGYRRSRNNHGQTAIHMAAMGGLSTAIYHWVEDANSKDYENRTPLHLAAEYGHQDCVNRLLKLSVEVNAKGGNRKRTPLHIACGRGDDDIVKSLLVAGADKDALDSEKITPLYCAVQEQKESTVKLLTEKGANKYVDAGGRIALHFAAETGNTTIFGHLMEGTDNYTRMRTLQRKLLHAASGGIDNNALIEQLVNMGVSVDEADSEGKTPLHCAALQGNSENIQRLVNAGANKEVRDNKGYTPLRSAAEHSDTGKARKCLGLLIELGADVNAADRSGRTLLHAIVTNKNLTDVIPKLLEAQARIEKTDEDGDTALHRAAAARCTEGIKMLLEHGAKVDVKNKKGETPQIIIEGWGGLGWWEKNTPSFERWWTVGFESNSEQGSGESSVA